MIEKTVYDYLNRVMSVPAYMEMPKNPTNSFLLIEKTGTSTNNHLETAIFAIQSHADTLFGAAALNEELKAAMDNIVVLDDIASCRINSDYNYTDGTMRDYRYQAVYQIVHY